MPEEIDDTCDKCGLPMTPQSYSPGLLKCMNCNYQRQTRHGIVHGDPARTLIPGSTSHGHTSPTM